MVPETHIIRGFQVIVENRRPDIATAAVLERLDEALALVERYQPRRIRHLQRDLARFWVVRYPCRGAYVAQARACVIELTFLARRDISAAQVAACIVHEGVHARVDRQCGSTTARDRAWEERLCRRAELDFANALPAELGAPVRQRAEAILQAPDEDIAPEIDWTEAQRRQELLDRRTSEPS